jgi:hypothetical protein
VTTPFPAAVNDNVVDQPIAICIFGQIEGVGMSRVVAQRTLFVAPGELYGRPLAV